MSTAYDPNSKATSGRHVHPKKMNITRKVFRLIKPWKKLRVNHMGCSCRPPSRTQLLLHLVRHAECPACSAPKVNAPIDWSFPSLPSTFKYKLTWISCRNPAQAFMTWLAPGTFRSKPRPQLVTAKAWRTRAPLADKSIEPSLEIFHEPLRSQQDMPRTRRRHDRDNITGTRPGHGPRHDWEMRVKISRYMRGARLPYSWNTTSMSLFLERNINTSHAFCEWIPRITLSKISAFFPLTLITPAHLRGATTFVLSTSYGCFQLFFADNWH